MDAVLGVDALEQRTSRTLWEAALQADGTVREKAFGVEVTGLLGDLPSWPKGLDVLVVLFCPSSCPAGQALRVSATLPTGPGRLPRSGPVRRVSNPGRGR